MLQSDPNSDSQPDKKGTKQEGDQPEQLTVSLGAEGKIIYCDTRCEDPDFIGTAFDGKLRGRGLQVNYYPNDRAIIVGGGRNEESNHQGLSDVYCDNHRSHLSSPDPRYSFLPGFVRDKQYIIRVQRYFDYSERTDDRDSLPYLQENIRRHETIFRMLEEAAQQGLAKPDISLVFEGPNDLTFAKILGRLYQIEPETELGIGDARKEIDRQTRVLLEGEFYYAPRGTRYKSVRQFQEEIEEVRGDRSETLSYLNQLIEFLSPTTVNAAGAQEADLLVLDDSGKLDESSKTQEKLFQRLRTLRETLSGIGDSEWQKRQLTVSEQIESFVRDFRDANGEDYRECDIADPRFAIALAHALRRSPATSSTSYGDGISTPLIAVPLVQFDLLNWDPERDSIPPLIFHPSVDQEMQTIVRAVIEQQATHLDSPPLYCCMANPISPLTQERHSASFLQRYGQVLDDSFVLLIGNLHQEIKVVVRRDPHSVENCVEMIGPDGFEGCNPKAVSQVIFRLKKSQNRLMNSLYFAGADYPELSYTIPAWEKLRAPKIKDRLIRPYINGSRLDLVQRTEIKDEETLFSYGTGVGDVSAVNLVAQRIPESHETLITRKTRKEKPLEIRSFGTWEAFGNNTGAASREDYLTNVTPFFAAMIGGWIASAHYGRFGSRDEAPDLQELTDRFCRAWLNSFCYRYDLVQAGWASAKDEAHLESARLSALLGREFPPEWDLRRNLWLTDDLLQSDSEEVGSQILGGVADALKLYDHLLGDLPPSDQVGFRAIGNLIDATQSLLTNHNMAAGSYHSTTATLLSVDFSPYSAFSRTRLINTLDLSSTIHEFGQGEHIMDLWMLGTMPNFEDFKHELDYYYTDLKLSESQARRLHTVIQDTLKELTRARLGDMDSYLRQMSDVNTLCGSKVFRTTPSNRGSGLYWDV